MQRPQKRNREVTKTDNDRKYKNKYNSDADADVINPDSHNGIQAGERADSSGTQASKEDRRIYTMSKERPARAVLRMGVPLTMGMFIMVLYNLTDTYFVGLIHDDYQLAAVSLAYPVMMVMIAVSNMVGTGASSLIARCIGADDWDKANYTLTAGFELTLFSSLIIAVLGLCFLNPIVAVLGAKSNTAGYTAQYVGALLVGTFCIMGNYTFGQLLRSEGSVKYSVTGMIVGTVANIILDPIFIFTFKMEVLGAAVATVLGNLAAMLFELYYYIKRKTLLTPSRRALRPNREIMAEIFRVGIPATLETLLTTTAYVVNNNLAVAYGELTVAAMGVSQKLMTLGSYVYQGFAAGTQPLMGYNYGAGNYTRMLKIMKAGIMITTGIELCIMCVYGIFAPNLIGIFTETDTVIEIGARVLRANMFILPFVGSISSSRSTFQAMGKPQYALGITIVRQLALYIPLLLLFNHAFGFSGLIWAQPVTECIMMIASVTLLYTTLKKYERGTV